MDADHSVRVAVVDDNPDLVLVVSLWVRLDPRMQLVGTRANGYEALNLVRTVSPDVMVLDLHMAGLDGVETLARIRGCGYDTPVVIYSAHAVDQDRIQSMAAAGASYVPKLGTRRQLLDQIMALSAAQIRSPYVEDSSSAL